VNNGYLVPSNWIVSVFSFAGKGATKFFFSESNSIKASSRRGPCAHAESATRCSLRLKFDTSLNSPSPNAPVLKDLFQEPLFWLPLPLTVTEKHSVGKIRISGQETLYRQTEEDQLENLNSAHINIHATACVSIPIKALRGDYDCKDFINPKGGHYNSHTPLCKFSYVTTRPSLISSKGQMGDRSDRRRSAVCSS